MAPKRRPPTPAQRLAKNEADRRRRREHNIEFRGLQDKVLEFQALVATQNNELTRLRAEMANLQDTVQQQREQIHELNRRNQELMALENSVFDLDQFINLFEEAPNNEPATDGASTSQTGKGFGGAEDPNFGEEDQRQRKDKSTQIFQQLKGLDSGREYSMFRK